MTSPHTDQRDLPPGYVVDGRYEICAPIGEGAMGTVYRVRHARLDRTFAMKVMNAEHAVSDELVLRFHREAKAAASVGHPNIVDVTDMGQLDDGTAYIVQELLNGRHLARCVQEDGLFDAHLALHVTRQICAALSAVHAQRIVHRDLKPENIMIVERGGDPSFVKVLDFGICTLLEPDTDGPYARLTRTNVTLGTPLFMAPEQFSPQVQLDARTDIHAVGAILYFLLTERPLYSCRDLRHLCMRIASEPIPSVLRLRPDVPRELDALIQRACAKDPERRYASCADMIMAIDEVEEALATGRASYESHGLLDGTQDSLLPFSLPPSDVASTRAERSEPNTPELPRRDSQPSFLRSVPPASTVTVLSAMALAGVVLWLGVSLWSEAPPEVPAAAAEAPVESSTVTGATGPDPRTASQALPIVPALAAPLSPSDETTPAAAATAPEPVVAPSPSVEVAAAAAPAAERARRKRRLAPSDAVVERAPAAPAEVSPVLPMPAADAPLPEPAAPSAVPAGDAPGRESSPYRIPERSLEPVF